MSALSPRWVVAKPLRSTDGPTPSCSPPPPAGPETIWHGPRDRHFTADEHGRVLELVEVAPAEGRAGEPGFRPCHVEVKAVAFTKGRTLGGVWAARAGAKGKGGAHLLADAALGLVRVDGGGGGDAPHPELHVLSNHVNDPHSKDIGTPVFFADGLDEAQVGPRAGTVFFTDASYLEPWRDPRTGLVEVMLPAMLEFFTGWHTGRLLSYSPRDRLTKVEAKGFWFPNGVAVAKDGASVLFAETFGARVWRHHLAGPQAGQTVVAADGLPGCPDGISLAADGGFWVTIQDSCKVVAALAPRRFLRYLALLLPPSLLPQSKHGAVVKLSAAGEVEAAFHGSALGGITSATEHGGRLWLGTLGKTFGVLDLAGAMQAFRDLEQRVAAAAEEPTEKADL